MTQLTAADAREFYAEHQGRHFFDKLVAFMTEGPIVAIKLVGSDAVAAVRCLWLLWLRGRLFSPVHRSGGGARRSPTLV